MRDGETETVGRRASGVGGDGGNRHGHQSAADAPSGPLLASGHSATSESSFDADRTRVASRTRRGRRLLFKDKSEWKAQPLHWHDRFGRDRTGGAHFVYPHLHEAETSALSDALRHSSHRHLRRRMDVHAVSVSWASPQGANSGTPLDVEGARLGEGSAHADLGAGRELITSELFPPCNAARCPER